MHRFILLALAAAGTLIGAQATASAQTTVPYVSTPTVDPAKPQSASPYAPLIFRALASATSRRADREFMVTVPMGRRCTATAAIATSAASGSGTIAGGAVGLGAYRPVNSRP
jgi:hypothetical protein